MSKSQNRESALTQSVREFEVRGSDLGEFDRTSPKKENVASKTQIDRAEVKRKAYLRNVLQSTTTLEKP